MTAQILIVDDEAAIRRLVRGAVERAGLTAEEEQIVRRWLVSLAVPDEDAAE